jgi:hypothetical protein
MVDQPCYPGLVSQMGTQLDNLDAHDGWQPSKGHAGAAVLPALCAFAERSASVSGPEALAAMVLGYEIPYRASIALHTTADDYHTSGAWSAHRHICGTVNRIPYAVGFMPHRCGTELKADIFVISKHDSGYKNHDVCFLS